MSITAIRQTSCKRVMRSALVSALLLASCSGELLIDRHEPLVDSGGLAASGSSTASGGQGTTSGAAGSSSPGAAAGAGESAGSGATSVGASAGAPAGGEPSVGGASGGTSEGGAGASDGGAAQGGAGGGGCLTVVDCPLAPSVCAHPTCDEGLCGLASELEGTPVDAAPGDCQTELCDGATGIVPVVDESDLPQPSNPCLAGTCNDKGKPGTAPLPARTLCSDGSSAVMCDGVGHCVDCLKSSDCESDEVCSAAHACLVATCTDLDCGGVCPLCELGKNCLIDADCLSWSCDSITLTCVADHCVDHHANHWEGDVDCGGGDCPKCELGQKCYANFDCASNACDAITLTCIEDQCLDHHVDGLEKDVDCGGANSCARCTVGKKCGVDSDCVSQSCLGIPKTCQ